MLQIIFGEKTVMSTRIRDATVHRRMEPAAGVAAEAPNRKPVAALEEKKSVSSLLSAAGVCLLPHPARCCLTAERA